MVKKILFTNSEAEIRATGIQFQKDGEIMTVKARKEIIVTAGALQSPKILEISGVGSAKLLRSHNIDVQIDNPHIGENLQDHILCFIRALKAAMKEYVTTKTGPLLSIGVASYAYLPVLEFLFEDGQKTLQGLFDSHADHEKAENPVVALYYYRAKSLLESKDEAPGAFLVVSSQAILPVDPDSKDSPAGPVAGKYIMLGIMLSKPLSKESVHIESFDPNKEPAIGPTFLTHPLDMEIFARHMRYLETIAESAPLRLLLKENGGHWDPNSVLKD
ncbi:hypothetical protein MMC22_006374 [Lobaria immixta]|nr:hypothetical protein [Lobaria immixta]